MKKILFIIALALAFSASSLWAAGSCKQYPYESTAGFVRVEFRCTGDPADGSIPTQTLAAATQALIESTYYLYLVEAKPTAGGTAPDAADVAVNMSGRDQLGAKGVNLIHATATQETFPYSTFMSSYFYPLVRSAITVTVANQITASANFTIELVFVR
jgi:hypothetical protein